MAIIQWVSEEHELDDIYYYNIRLGIEKRAYELDYEMLHFFNDIPSSLGEEVVGVLCIGKFSREQIAKLERLKKTLVFVDSDTLNQDIHVLLLILKTPYNRHSVILKNKVVII